VQQLLGDAARALVDVVHGLAQRVLPRRVELGNVPDQGGDPHAANVGEHHLVASERAGIQRGLVRPDVEARVRIRIRRLPDRLLGGATQQATGDLALEDADDHRSIQRGHGAEHRDQAAEQAVVGELADQHQRGFEGGLKLLERDRTRMPVLRHVRGRQCAVLAITVKMDGR
jgi:hypothetical protein